MNSLTPEEIDALPANARNVIIELVSMLAQYVKLGAVKRELGAQVREANLSRQHELINALSSIFRECEPFQRGATIKISQETSTLRNIREIARRALANEQPMPCSAQSDIKR